jgi:RHS repeat-associated protein
METVLAVLPSDDSAGKPIPNDSIDVIPSRMIRLGSLEDPPWQIFNLHTDHLGTVRAETAVATGAVSLHDYLPFGQEITYQFSHNSHDYTGQEKDRESGLNYMKARYYGGTSQRFLSSDPLGGSAPAAQSWNRYSYVLGNPLKLVDPTGMYWAPGTPMPIIPGDPNGCTMCFARGDGWTDKQWEKFKEGAEQARQGLTEAAKRHFREKYGVDLDEIYQDGKGPTVNAVSHIDGEAHADYNRWTNEIDINLGDLFYGENGGLMDQDRLEHALIHESEHFANDFASWLGDLDPPVPPEIERAIIDRVGDQAWSGRHEGKAYGWWAELVQYGRLY